jgi:hypothetical protein
MKRVIAFSLLIPLLGAMIWLLLREAEESPAAEQAKAPPKLVTKGPEPAPRVPPGEAPAATPTKFPDAFYEQRLAAEKLRLSRELADLLESGDVSGTRQKLDDVLYRFAGDPATILWQTGPLAELRSPEARLMVAESFLTVGIRREEAATVLREIVTQPARVRQKGPGDLRLRAAGVLAEHGVTAASDDIWALFRSSHEESLLFNLARLGDARPKEVVLPTINRPASVIGFAEILGRLRITEARESLGKVLKFRADQKMPPDPDRLRAEWAMYRITEEKQYLDYLLANHRAVGAIDFIASIRTPETEALLTKLVRSDEPNLAQTAFVGLYLKNPGSNEVRAVIEDFFTGKLNGQYIGVETILQVAANLDEPRLTRLGFTWDQQRQLPSFTHWYNRRSWPFRDPRIY